MVRTRGTDSYHPLYQTKDAFASIGSEESGEKFGGADGLIDSEILSTTHSSMMQA